MYPVVGAPGRSLLARMQDEEEEGSRSTQRAHIGSPGRAVLFHSLALGVVKKVVCQAMGCKGGGNSNNPEVFSRSPSYLTDSLSFSLSLIPQFLPNYRSRSFSVRTAATLLGPTAAVASKQRESQDTAKTVRVLL